MSARAERGHLIEGDDVPDDVVTMHSKVRMRDVDSGRVYVTTVTLPAGRGTCVGSSLLRAYPKIALLGARVGDDIVWRFAGRLRHARIEQLLFQPESSARLERMRSRRTTRIPVLLIRRDSFELEEMRSQTAE
jgi:regulator of nucleoside diphosphate kinase